MNSRKGSFGCGFLERYFLNHFLDDKCYDTHPDAQAKQPEGNGKLRKTERGFNTLNQLKDSKLSNCFSIALVTRSKMSRFLSNINNLKFPCLFGPICKILMQMEACTFSLFLLYHKGQNLVPIFHDFSSP